jgi:hypothetical protein
MPTGSLAEARSHNVPPDVFIRHYKEIRETKHAHHDTGMAVARAKKAAKADGIDLDALKLLEKFADLDTDEAELQLQHLRQYAAWIELPIGSQLNFFADAKAPTANPQAEEFREWSAGGVGFDAGKAGHTRDTNPHRAGSAEYVAWDKSWSNGNKAWLKGQKQIAGQMKANGNANGKATGGKASSGKVVKIGRPRKQRGAEAERAPH